MFKNSKYTVAKSLPIKAEIISSNTQLDCNGDSDGSFCFFAEGGWTQPFDNNPINTPETGWEIHIHFLYSTQQLV